MEGAEFLSQAPKKLQILRVITRMNVGGPARQVSFLHRRCLVDGHDTTLCYGLLDEGEGDMSDLLTGSPQTLNLNGLRRPISIKNDVLAILNLFWHMIRHDVNVLHTHTAKAGMVGRLALTLAQPVRWCLGYSRTLSVHTFHGHVFSGYFSESLTNVYKMIERVLWRWTDVVIALTPRLGSEILGHLGSDPSKLRIVPLGLDLEPYLQVSRKNVFMNQCQPKYWVGWVGRMVGIKNPFRFIALAEQLKRLLDSEVGFVMVGDGPLMTAVQEALKNSSLSDAFVLTGWRSDLSEVYAGLDVLVNTSDNEGTPVAILEAMASGLCVLATDVGGTAEIFESASDKEPLIALPCEKFLETGSVQIETWLKTGAKLSESARRELVERFSEERLYQSLMSLYHPA